ncbi:Ankyrin repeat-containing domain protein [Niveomyces insectorum RCEF 264]|uniref:Ankyrin repeat-containing domain protein n=1 Tax=Niveomyces insectorum RCEF 264 TaxID=1081102 RepID=A0A167MB88_9HYPO|nr:Ankyrin repeat-containing domain protein [Niveomyces insectorum RCEF 264]
MVLLEELLVQGADPNIPDATHSTPLHYVVMSCVLPAAGKLLVQNGAKVDVFDKLHRNVFDKTVLMGPLVKKAAALAVALKGQSTDSRDDTDEDAKDVNMEEGIKARG